METKKQTLADIGNKVPFSVPENYFSQLNDTIMASLPEKQAPVIEPISIWDKAKPWAYMAAMFLGLFFTVRVLVINTNTQQEDYWSGVEISEEEFFDYIETQFVDEDYYDLIQNQDYLNSL